MGEFEKTEDYQLFCEERLQNPYPLFSKMRNEEPVHWSPQMKLWLLTRYDDVFVALRDKRLSASRQAMYEQALPEEMKKEVAPLLEHLKNWLIFLDPPEHTRLRRLINTAFTPKMLEHLRPRVLEIAEAQLAEIPAGAPFILKDPSAFPFRPPLSARCLVSHQKIAMRFNGLTKRWYRSAFAGGQSCVNMRSRRRCATPAHRTLHATYARTAENPASRFDQRFGAR